MVNRSQSTKDASQKVVDSRDGGYLKDELYELVRTDPSIFEFLQDGSLDGIWYWDVEEPSFEWMSPSFWHTLGYDPADMKHLSSEWQDLIHPDDLQEALHNFEAHCKDPSHPYDQTVRYRHRDGSTVWVRCRGLAIRDASGRPIRMLGAHNDVTALKEAQERLQMEARFRATVESAPTAIVMIDRDGRIALVNREMERLFGYKREELLKREIEILIPERFRSTHPELRGEFIRAPEAREMGAGRDLFALHKDGSEFPVEIGLNPVRTDDGDFVLAVVVDLTERKRGEAALHQANEALMRSNDELQRFAYVASHDLQNPMRSIASFVDLLQEEYAEKLDDQAKDWIRRTVESVRHLQRLIQDLLEYSRVDSRAHPFEEVELREVVDHAVSLLEASVSEAHAEVDCSELPTVMGDRSQLVQLMLNLIGNALKYRGEAPPRIQVSAEHGGHEWTVAVRDNGIGIAQRHQERIFEIFKRLHDQREYPGSGIGLALCRRVVHRHGGRIWVESDVGEGSVFYFTLPEAS